MPFTPESMLKAEKLDYLHLNLYDDMLHAKWKNFGDRATTPDPVVEAFRARRSHWERYEVNGKHLYDVHIVIEHRDTDIVRPDGRIERHYGFSYCPYMRDHDDVTPEQLKKEFFELLRIIFIELITMFDEWHDADNGMAAFLNKGNKSSLDDFLYSMKYKDPDPETLKKRAKEERTKKWKTEHPNGIPKT